MPGVKCPSNNKLGIDEIYLQMSNMPLINLLNQEKCFLLIRKRFKSNAEDVACKVKPIRFYRCCRDKSCYTIDILHKRFVLTKSKLK